MLTGPALIGPATPVRRRWQLLAACLTALAVLAGCSGGTGSTVSTAVQDSSSAMATARLALDLESAGRLTRAAGATALEDALKELQASRNSVLKLSPGSEEDRSTVREVLAVLDACTSALTTARDAVSSDDGAPSLADGQRELASAADRLSRLDAKAGGQ